MHFKPKKRILIRKITNFAGIYNQTFFKPIYLPMKQIFLFLLVILAFTRINSQSLSISKADGTPVASGETIYASGLLTEEIVVELKVTNNGSVSKDILAKKILKNVVSGSMDVFCWGLCFPPFVMVSPDALAIGAGATNTEFSGHYTANGLFGQSTIMYVFYDKNNPNDSAAVNVVFVPSNITLGEEGAGVLCNETKVASGVYTEEIVFELKIKNNSADSKDLFIRKIEKELISGTSMYFCWGACYAPTVNLSPVAITVPAGETSSEFSAHYTANQISGVSKVMYVVFDSRNPQDSIWFNLEFDGHVSGDGIPAIGNEIIVKSYPNPVTDKVTFEYNLPSVDGTAAVRIRNLTGSVLKTIKLDGKKGQTTVDVTDLNSGLYLYSVEVNGKNISTKKLTIN
jgi:hypothetical protein